MDKTEGQAKAKMERQYGIRPKISRSKQQERESQGKR